MGKYMILVCIACSMLMNRSFAQPDDPAFEPVMRFLETQGAMSGANVATVTDAITEPFNNNRQKTMAIYAWIGKNFSLDPKLVRSDDNRNILPEQVMRTRKSTSLGIATLFQEMCSQADIRCLIVDGYHKYNMDQINDPAEEPNYYWNVVQLGNTSSEWNYVDVSRACGRLDAKMSKFLPEFSSLFFFPDKTTFNREHYPVNSAWLMGEAAATLKEYYNRPIIGPAAYRAHLRGIYPFEGRIKIKPGQPIRFSYRMNRLSNVQEVTMIKTEGKKVGSTERMAHEINGNELVFDHIFRQEGEFETSLYINGEWLLSYWIEVSE
jgi:hypothetical protein